MEQKEIINKYDFKFKKKYGQNFLTDQNILNKIVAKSEIDKDTLVIEIGVGAGALTLKMQDLAKNIIGYEIDSSLKGILKEQLDGKENVEIIFDDFLTRNVKEDLNKYNYQKLFVVANLPYYITTPIITKIIEDKLNVNKIVIMVQKEVGDRFGAKAGTKEYNSLTIFLNYYFNIKKIMDVSRNVFIPKPNVDSIIIEMDAKENNYGVKDESIFFKLIRDSFKYKRKNLRNNLRDYNLNIVEKVLDEYNLDLSVRAEQLSIEQFVKISNEISEN